MLEIVLSLLWSAAMFFYVAWVLIGSPGDRVELSHRIGTIQDSIKRWRGGNMENGDDLVLAFSLGACGLLTLFTMALFVVVLVVIDHYFFRP
jgi:hypothetical protein